MGNMKDPKMEHTTGGSLNRTWDETRGNEIPTMSITMVNMYFISAIWSVPFLALVPGPEIL